MMNIHYLFLFCVMSSGALVMYPMHTLLEEQLLAQKISVKDYLNCIADGAYDKELAHKMTSLQTAEYNHHTKHKNVQNLYKIISKVITFGTKPGSDFSPEQIQEITKSQIELKYLILLDYRDEGIIQIPSVSGSGE